MWSLKVKGDSVAQALLHTTTETVFTATVYSHFHGQLQDIPLHTLISSIILKSLNKCNKITWVEYKEMTYTISGWTWSEKTLKQKVCVAELKQKKFECTNLIYIPLL